VPCAQRLWSFLSLGGNFGGDVCFPIYGLAAVTVGSAPEKKQRQRAVIESTRTLQGAGIKLCPHQTPSNANTAFTCPNLLARLRPRRMRARHPGGIVTTVKITRNSAALAIWSSRQFPRVIFGRLVHKTAQLAQPKGHQNYPMALKLGAGAGFEPATFRL
jgi:hypothetical protein